MKKTIFLFCISFYCSQFVSAQWERQYTSPTNKHLYCVYFTDSTHGWTVGESGTILKFDGSSWIAQKSGTTDALKSVFFVDKTHGWAVGDSGTILRNDGDKWTKINTAHTNIGLRSVFFIDTTHGWAVGQFGTILKYEGKQWIKQFSPVDGLTDIDLNSVFFTDAHTGWAVGNKVILKYNGGVWLQHGYFLPYRLSSVYFPTADLGWAVGSDETGSMGVILKFDGTNWEPLQIEVANATLASVYFTYPNNGWIVGAAGTILKYENNLWQLSDIFFEKINDLSSVFFTDPNTGWAVGDEGTILKFDGYNWTRPSNGAKNYNFNSIYFENSGLGFVVGNGYDDYGKHDALYCKYTVNFWSKKYDDTVQYFNSIFFKNGLGYIVGGDSNKGSILALNDSNDFSTYIDPGSHSEFLSVYLSDTSNIWVSGKHGLLLHYDSLSWNHFTESDEDIYSLCFPNYYNGWAIGNRVDNGFPNCKILKCDGSQWKTIFTDTTHLKYNSLYFTDAYNGLAVGNYHDTVSEILRTTDGGYSWNIDKIDTTTVLNSIFCTDAANCWTVGTMGKILYWDGTRWVHQTSGTDRDLNTVFFIDADTGWVAGNQGTILHTTNGGITGVNDNRKENTGCASNIFPNPFNHEAKITYDIETKSFVSLKIFDINGKEILNLVNRTQEKGKYSVVVPGLKLPARIYFYRLQTARSVETRKIIKL